MIYMKSPHHSSSQYLSTVPLRTPFRCQSTAAEKQHTIFQLIIKLTKKNPKCYSFSKALRWTSDINSDFRISCQFNPPYITKIERQRIKQTSNLSDQLPAVKLDGWTRRVDRGNISQGNASPKILLYLSNIQQRQLQNRLNTIRNQTPPLLLTRTSGDHLPI